LYELDAVFSNITVKKASKEKIKIYKKFFNKKKNDVLIQNLDDILLSLPFILADIGRQKNIQITIEKKVSKR